MSINLNLLPFLQTKKCQSNLVKLKLRDYQLVGSNWILSMHHRGIGCILSDEEGLGKKIQTIHFLSDLVSERGNWGPHLIVTSPCLLLIWQIIFIRWCPALKLFVYYGDTEERISQRMVCSSISILLPFHDGYVGLLP